MGPRTASRAKLRAGAKVADAAAARVGFSTLMMAQAFPNSRFTGYDFHEPSVEEARRHAQAHGLTDRVSFEAAAAKDIGETGFDLVTAFDCLHDMGDPRGCARHMRRILKDDGAWMIVEPIAGDRPTDNFTPPGRIFYNASTMICVPTSLDQEVGEGLGAQAGEAKLSEVIRDGGFTRVRRATEGSVQHGLSKACAQGGSRGNQCAVGGAGFRRPYEMQSCRLPRSSRPGGLRPMPTRRRPW